VHLLMVLVLVQDIWCKYDWCCCECRISGSNIGCVGVESVAETALYSVEGEGRYFLDTMLPKGPVCSPYAS
jgi:hypothetical protein